MADATERFRATGGIGAQMVRNEEDEEDISVVRDYIMGSRLTSTDGEDAEEGDHIFAAAGQLLRYNQGLPEPTARDLEPNCLLGSIYSHGLQRLIGLQPPEPISYAIPQFTFENASSFVSSADGDVLLAHQFAVAVRATPASPRPPAHAVVVRAQDYEYKRSKMHTLSTTDVEALYAGIRAHPHIRDHLAHFEVANGLQGQTWIDLSLFLQQGAYGRNHAQFGCARAPHHGRPRCRSAVRYARAQGGPPCRRCRAW